MGEFKEQKWELSEEKEQSEYKMPEEGMRVLFIKDCLFNKDENKYTILFDDVEDPEVHFSVRYWLDTKDKNTEQLIPNVRARNTLIGLGRALAGKDIGVPKDTSVVGGVVRGEVKYGQDNKYPRIYRFSAATEMEVLAASKIDQYFAPEE